MTNSNFTVSYRPTDNSDPEYVSLVVSEELGDDLFDIPTEHTLDGFESLPPDGHVVIRQTAERVFEVMLEKG
ncbi:MAG: hypothetical protein ABII07_05385 [Patescibacteria group bacterium]|nr:hypothetical protein [Patescibacteria group bacterium]